MACEVEDNAFDLHRLRSDISSLLQQNSQVDELVVEAIKLKRISKEGETKIQSFSCVLSHMLSSLKPWVSTFQSAFRTETQQHQPVSCDESRVCDSPQEATLDSLVSPSPLVSWRANCTVERGRQMFMLTPLPLPSKSHLKEFAHSKSTTLLALPRDMTSSTGSVVVKPTPIKLVNEVPRNQENGVISSPTFPKRDGSMLVMMTPCLKMSPPKSCVLLEPISEISHMGNDKVRKSTPFPVGINYSDSEGSESPGGDDASRGLALKYPELLGIRHVSKSGIGKKTVQESPDWLMSPPKTCVLLEPTDEKSLKLEEKTDNESCIEITESILKQQVSKFEGDDDVSEYHNQAKKSGNQESTPMWHEPESLFQTGKRPGENTLKKELWTRFEAASTWGCQPKLLTVQNNTQKGFLDLLEEASCDDE
ncbi:uncharacterized protein LOC113851006 [Abrus precatorius]|uniref:Uncharacterized protein LOC113851006 n=1 Tax=Abrus precatorius TaxID=3816 RepID=A0A8B8K2Q5_ABRPR|nr:uncharacterized protein LOC113851006 [Abrus precatorius]